MRTPAEILELLQSLSEKHGNTSMVFLKAFAEVTEEEAAQVKCLAEEEKDKFRILIGRPTKATPTSTPTE